MNDLRLFHIKWVQLLFSIVLAVIGGFLFQWIHCPIPWLLGPMIVVFIGSRLFKRIKPVWPGPMRDSGMVIIGYMLGLSFTLETFKQIGKQLPSMILLTALLLVCTYLIALMVAKFSGLNFPTVLMGSIPGGLSQMIALAEELKGIDLTVVTFLQVSRIIMIIFFVPLFIFSPLFGSSLHHSLPDTASAAAASWGGLFPHILVYAVVCTACALLWKKIKFPTAFLLGPMVATIILHLSGLSGPALPSSLVSISQLLIGGYLGLMLKPENLNNKLKIILLALLSGTALLICSVVLSLLLTQLHPVPLSTSFLSLSPGGMDQMGIIAKEVNADLSFVTCYQLFRTLFIFLVVPPVLKALFKAMHRRRASDKVA
ncbi:AbrB family transcriptional regulator [Paenibacillus frigoriresistens]|uniref:AbrB family transcriptional regulator n=1 Tax=Paenibacillus alginolyticus TaxID=59839 RepID=UPI0015672FED|nr:AbrB family transcriptional regulator [Paenibacillus frigoriresistens]NRF95537.1 AbrB family transcriptional regulator [Paenibacillus frigoriresistens]